LNRQNGDRASIRQILEKIVDLYSVVYPKETCFRVCVFVPDYDHDLLRPWLWANSEKSCPIDFDENSSEDKRQNEKYFSFASNNIVSKVWRQKESISTSTNIQYIKGVVTPMSIMAIPLLSSDAQNRAAKERGIKLPEIFGILCVVSNQNKIFIEDRAETNESLVQPFISRIILESIVVLLAKFEKDTASIEI